MKPEERSRGANGERLARIEWQRKQRNLFALIRAIIRRSSGDDVEDYKAHLNGRLDALTRLNATAGIDEYVDLALIVSEELLAHGQAEGEGVIIRGPIVKLRADDAQTLGLAIHELAANAIKFAPAIEVAPISVTWTSESGLLRLKWRETREEAPEEMPGAPGFGTEWLTETLPYELNAKVDYLIDATGVACSINMTLR